MTDKPEQTYEEWRKANPHLMDFVDFLPLLNKESDRGRALISSGILEEQLRKVLIAFMADVPIVKSMTKGPTAPFGSFSARINGAFALGLLSDHEFRDLHLVRSIRNEFAHNVHMSFDKENIKAMCEKFELKAHDYTDGQGKDVMVGPVSQFATAVVSLVLKLTNRPHYVGKERRTVHQWPE